MTDKITRRDLESKLQEIRSEVDTASATAKPAGISIGAAVVAGAVGVAYVIGQRKAAKRTTVVEIRRM